MIRLVWLEKAPVSGAFFLRAYAAKELSHFGVKRYGRGCNRLAAVSGPHISLIGMDDLSKLLEEARRSARAAREKAMRARSSAVENEWVYVAAMWEMRARAYEEALKTQLGDGARQS